MPVLLTLIPKTFVLQIYSPKYPSYYQESKACYYVIASSNESVQIHFDDLQLKQGDTFYIYDALTDLTPSKKIWSTIPSWHNVSSATKVMKIIFVPGSRTNLYENLQGKSRWKIVFDSF
ncbi:CUB domain protein [Oesophagostomum dentatum]|uniref:CUB domain protein n=1 Tax=Oesophagostomum dentatum TaxID=61180 RepID=A0A0B1S0E8_OESDE|nr:CUB domain protein [Oesophagostomum dentatum]